MIDIFSKNVLFSKFGSKFAKISLTVSYVTFVHFTQFLLERIILSLVEVAHCGVS